MQTSLPYHDEPVRVPPDDQFTVRLRGLSGHQDGRQAGALLGKTCTSDPIDATVVLLANPGDRIVTSDPTDMTRLASAPGNRPVIITC